MLCQNCKINPATVFVRKFINGEEQEFNLCTECAKKLDANISFDKLFQGFLETFLSYEAPVLKQNSFYKKNAVCNKCGMTYEKFRSIGRLGCDECYATFRSELIGVLKNLQGSTKHNGKVPNKISLKFSRDLEIENLTNELNKAIELEEYEEAARLRDEIKKIKQNKN